MSFLIVPVIFRLRVSNYKFNVDFFDELVLLYFVLKIELIALLIFVLDFLYITCNCI